MASLPLKPSRRASSSSRSSAAASRNSVCTPSIGRDLERGRGQQALRARQLKGEREGTGRRSRLPRAPSAALRSSAPQVSPPEPRARHRRARPSSAGYCGSASSARRRLGDERQQAHASGGRRRARLEDREPLGHGDDLCGAAHLGQHDARGQRARRTTARGPRASASAAGGIDPHPQLRTGRGAAARELGDRAHARPAAARGRPSPRGPGSAHRRRCRAPWPACARCPRGRTATSAAARRCRRVAHAARSLHHEGARRQEATSSSR